MTRSELYNIATGLLARRDYSTSDLTRYLLRSTPDENMVSEVVAQLRAYPIRAISLAILDLGSARNPHVLRVRSGFSALSVSKLAAPITPTGIGS